MSLYAIADLHLSFAETVDKPMDKFGPEWEHHAERLASAWSSIVSNEDTVVIPGDISWGLSLEEAIPDLAFIDALPGRKLLLRGNHDFWWSSMRKMKGLFSSIDFIQNDAKEVEDLVVCGSRGWYFPGNPPKEMSAEESDKIYRRELLRMEMSLKAAEPLREGKRLVVAMHFPPIDSYHEHSEFIELFEQYSVDTVVHGHLHGKRIIEAREGIIGGIEYRLVSFDKLDGKPVKVI